MVRGKSRKEDGVPEGRRITRSLSRKLTRSSVAVEPLPAKRMMKIQSSDRGPRRGRPKKNEGNLVDNLDIKEEEDTPEEAENSIPTESNTESSMFVDHLDIKEEKDELTSEGDKAEETEERLATEITSETSEVKYVDLLFVPSDSFTNNESTDRALYIVLTSSADGSTFTIDFVKDLNTDSIDVPIIECNIEPMVVEEATSRPTTTDRSTGNGSCQTNTNEQNYYVFCFDVKEGDESEENDKLPEEETTNNTVSTELTWKPSEGEEVTNTSASAPTVNGSTDLSNIPDKDMSRKEEEAIENERITRCSSQSLKTLTAAASPLPAKKGKKKSSGRGRGRPKKTKGNFVRRLEIKKEEEEPKTKEVGEENDNSGDTENSLSTETNMKTTEVEGAATSFQSDNLSNYVSADQGTSHKDVGLTENRRLTRSIRSSTSSARVPPLPSKRGKITSSSVRGKRRGRPRKIRGNDVSYFEIKVGEEVLKCKEVSEEDKPVEAETIQNDIDSIHSQTSEINTEPSNVEETTIAQATEGLPLQIDNSMDNGSTVQGNNLPGQQRNQMSEVHYSYGFIEEPVLDGDFTSLDKQEINWLEVLDFQNMLDMEAYFDAVIVQSPQAGSSTEPMETVPGQQGSQINVGPLSHAYKKEPVIDIDLSRLEENEDFNLLEELDNKLLKESNARSTSEIDNMVDFNQQEPICEGLDDNINTETFATRPAVNNENAISFNTHKGFWEYFNIDSNIQIPTENIGTVDYEFVVERQRCLIDQLKIIKAINRVYLINVLRFHLKLTETYNKQEAQRKKIQDLNDKPKINDFFYKFNPPYFKDRHRFPALLNNETKRRNKLEIKPLSQYIREGRVEFNSDENKKLLKLVGKQLVEKVTLRLERKKRYFLRTSRSVQTSSKVKQQIAAIDKEIEETKNKTLTELLENKDDWTFDWDRISIVDFDQKHSSHTCSVYWENYLKPSVNKGPWSEEEEKRLVEIVKQYKHENWVKITEELGTNRSAVIVFKHYQQKFFKKSEFYKEPAREWSEEEERDVKKWVESYKSNRVQICWTTIAQILGRTAVDVQSHWVQLTQPEIVKGKFDKYEDTMILEAIQQHGLDSIVLRHKFKWRTIQQISYRYKRLTENTKQGQWKPEEDKLLVKLIKQYGVGKWSSIGKAMVTRNRTQVRQRYNVLKKMDKYKGQI